MFVLWVRIGKGLAVGKGGRFSTRWSASGKFHRVDAGREIDEGKEKGVGLIREVVGKWWVSYMKLREKGRFNR